MEQNPSCFPLVGCRETVAYPARSLDDVHPDYFLSAVLPCIAIAQGSGMMPILTLRRVPHRGRRDVSYLYQDLDYRPDRYLLIAGADASIEGGIRKLPLADPVRPDHGADRQSGAARHASPQRRRIRG